MLHSLFKKKEKRKKSRADDSFFGYKLTWKSPFGGFDSVSTTFLVLKSQ
jgi:hypothetical protein